MISRREILALILRVGLLEANTEEDQSETCPFCGRVFNVSSVSGMLAYGEHLRTCEAGEEVSE